MRRGRYGSRTASDLLQALAALLLASGSNPAAAADLQVSPIRLTLDAQSPNAVMNLINRGNSDTLLQLSVMAWSQDTNGDVLVPTRDVLANPGVFLLKAGEQQVARFALRVPPDIRERSYRVVIQEVPRQRVENGLTTVLRLLVPIFVLTPSPAMALEWSAVPIDGGLELRPHNTGNVHVQIKTVKLGGAAAGASKTVNLYVLPAATGRIRIPLPKAVPAGAVVQLSAESDQGGISASVRVGASEGAAARP